MGTETILVTGGAGFIGSHLSERLIREGYKVICLDNFNDYYDPRLKWENIRALLDHPNFTLVEGDILDKPLLDSVFTGAKISAVVHLAARAGVRPSIANPTLYMEVNVVGTANLLELTAQNGVKRFIFASSSSVYGNNRVPFSEDDRVDNPVSPYAASKRAGELLCYTFHQNFGLDITCLRLFTVYGPRQRPEMAVHKFTQKIFNDEPIEIYGDGETSRDYTFISDIIDGIKSCVEQTHGFEIINLGNSHPIKLMDLVQTIEKLSGKKARLRLLPPQPGDVERTYADISKAQRMLGYNPKVDFETGVEIFIRWYRQSNTCAASRG